jgi:uncharacterized protein (DUF1501 family)
MSQNRRDFLVRSTCAALGMAAFQGTLKQFGLANLLATDGVVQTPHAPNCTGGYKALVCIFLNGGNDGANMVIPYDNTYYPAYANVRPGLAISQASLVPTNNPPSMGGRQFAFHPNMPEIAALFNQNKLAVVTNVGTLVEPTTQPDYMSGAVKKPFSLFSHSDQVQANQTSRADSKSPTGWGGRTVDAVLSCNAGSSFPTLTSISGSTSFCIGLDQRPLSIGTGALNSVLVLNGFTGSATDVARKASMDYLRTIDLTATMIAGASGITQQGVDISSIFSTDPTINTVFPNTGLGNQLRQVAKIMKLNQTPPGLGLVRQIFFVSQGGYDTHQDQPNDQGNNFLTLSQAMNAFYAATLELGLQNSVTTFTLSDFGRTLQPSGSGSSIGTDHGWASHYFVMGGAVNGGDYYGNLNPLTGSRFPVHQLGGPDDTTNNPNGRGRFIPATSIEEYGVTLAKWFGVTSGDIPSVFPLIGNFESAPYPGLGFV